MRFRSALVTTALAFSACGGPPGPPAGDPTAPASESFAAHHAGATEDCSRASQADFPGAFTSPQNLVVGPLVMVGAAFTDAQTVREFGGNKFPLLVKAGHTVTIRLAPRARAIAGLAYGPLPQGEVKLRDTYRSVRFVACAPGEAHTFADGAEITFWSGFVLAREPACIPLLVTIDGGPPRRVPLSLGVRC